MSQDRKIKRKKLVMTMKEYKRLVDRYNASTLQAKRDIEDKWIEIKGFIFRKLSINTLWVLRKVFKFSKKKFDEFNIIVMNMSDICRNDDSVDVDGFHLALKEECKFTYESIKEKPVEPLKWIEQDNAKELVSYAHVFNCLSTNKVIPLNTLWETMIMWSLHLMGFGKVRLERFQDEMRKLWLANNQTTEDMRIKIKAEVGLEKIGTGPIRLPVYGKQIA